MKLIDVHSHWPTKYGYVLQTEEELAQQKQTWNSEPRYETEEEMAAYFRKVGVRTMLDLAFTKNLPLEKVREYHDYALATQRRYPDVILGNWLQIDPRTGAEGAAEFKRCVAAGAGFVGICISGAVGGIAASDPVFAHLCRASIEVGSPVLVMVGYSGAGAGLRGGKGVQLELCHPRYVDQLAIAYPDLEIIAGRPAWPWQEEMIAVMLHKPNVWNELHGWSPKYHTDSLKREITRRLKKRVMFGADYPLFRYERLIEDWRSLGYDEETLSLVFHKNAERLFAKVPGIKL
jgi:hypothetical protein